MCKFIQFLHSSYLGIGYLKVHVDKNVRGSVNIIDNLFQSMDINRSQTINNSSFLNDLINSSDILPTEVNFIPYVFNGAQIGGSSYKELSDGNLNTGNIKY